MTGERLRVGRVTVQLSNTAKVLFPEDGITKGDLVRLRELLSGELGPPTFVKTTGGRGLHMHVPLNARQDFDMVRKFARRAAELLAARNPDLITTEQRRDKRGLARAEESLRRLAARPA